MNGQRIDGAEQLAPKPGSSLVMVGNFDGVHVGHRWVLERGIQAAAAAGLDPVVLTFHPHPSEVLGRGTLPVLTPLERKVALMARLSPRLKVVVEPFTRELAAASPSDFARELLSRALGARQVIVGDNFRFGRGRSGDFGTLRALGAELGFEARAEPLHGDPAGVISSTRIRDLIASGAVDAAEQLLGRPHAVSGPVREGDQRARQLGVPSANLGSVPELLPAQGVYAVLVDVLGPGGYEALGRGIANVGVRPTHGAGEVRAEAHVLDYSGDLYGREIRVHLVARLRDERRFSGLDELKAQLERDKQDGARVLASRAPDPSAHGAWH
ncbi:MAG TPA: riboflavin biosynthesis protein RibF [Polyangiaceae bacterium]|nr:riboflavin biosynthesis protein RibF [Polyangiaceae bacterium]